MKTAHRFHAAAVHALDMVMPRTCWLTGAPVSDSQSMVVSALRDELAELLQYRYCHRCGADRLPGVASCPFCPNRRLGTAEIVRAGPYAHPLKELISRFKFGRHWGLAPLLASQMADAWKRAASPSIDVLVPIPLHWRREFSRGFNQSRELARCLSRLIGVPTYDGLVRRKSTGHQSAASSVHQRRENLRGAFESKPVDWSNQEVWLVDDVCTTGSTVHAAVAAFTALPPKYQPARVSAIVLAVTGVSVTGSQS